MYLQNVDNDILYLATIYILEFGCFKMNCTVFTLLLQISCVLFYTLRLVLQSTSYTVRFLAGAVVL